MRTRLLAFVSVVTLAIVVVLVPRLSVAQDATPVADEGAATELITQGQEIYQTLCIACHRAGGAGAEGTEGLPGIPPLANNPFVALEDPRVVVQTILNGRAGMPSFRSFSDEEIAGVASYIRQDFGNEAGPVDPALVTEIRGEFDVEPPPDATPIATPFTGGEATPGSVDSAGTPEPVPTLGQ
jgi:mono/diheme cytochrome c family protein